MQVLVYVVAWFAVEFEITSMSNGEVIVRGACINTIALQSRFNCHQNSA